MNQHPHRHHHQPHGKPTRLIVFFLENETVTQEIEDQLLNISWNAQRIRSHFLKHFGDAVPAWLRDATRDNEAEIVRLIKVIRGEVISMTTTAIQPPTGAVTQLVIGDPIGIMVAVLEADDSGTVFFPPDGPLSFEVADPSNTVTQGLAADGVTPTFLDNGSGNTGDVDVKVTDAGNNLVGDASFAVVAKTPPPPPVATQLGVFFVPAGSASGSSSGSGTAPAVADAVKKAQTAAGIVITDPHAAK